MHSAVFVKSIRLGGSTGFEDSDLPMASENHAAFSEIVAYS